MMRLPLFEFRAPRTLEEAARILDGEKTNAMPLAGGTDLLPNMKRRQQVPRTLMSLRHIRRYRWRSAFPKWIDGAGASGVRRGYAADPQYGNARGKHLSGYAVQLLRSKLRVEEVDQLLPKERRNNVLGRTGKFKVHGCVLDGHSAGTDGPRCPRPPGVALGRTRNAAFRALQQ